MTRLKLMVDYNLGKPVADRVNTLGKKVEATTTIDHGFRSNTADADLVAYARKAGILLLTHDVNTMDERTFPPCSHGGIIIVREKFLAEDNIANCIKNFCKLGKRRQLAKGHITHLWKNRAKIITHKEIFEFKLKF
ncbi:MAG TPA: DUF5615 family PIN-like protein [Acidobacteriota bacterium]|nr:DUF5615 family PIN-like protein [Acidobacteriota bacterium]